MNGTMNRTACGLYVLAGVEPRQWPNFTWTTEVADLPGQQVEFDALTLAGKEVMDQVGQNTATGQYVTPTDVAFAALHIGAVGRAEHPDLDFADPSVTDAEVARDARRTGRTWTVCGVLSSSWRTCCMLISAGTPKVAYLRAWEMVSDEHGEHMLLAGVHEGWYPPVDVFGYADPWATSGEQMLVKARDWGAAS